MQLRLVREIKTPESTIGTLTVETQLSKWTCRTLELPEKDGLPGSCITTGTYSIILAPSPKFLTSKDAWEREEGKSVPHLVNVPNRSNILIHWGNTARDTEGCILVGHGAGTDFIGQSRLTFIQLMAQILKATSNGEQLSITIS